MELYLPLSIAGSTLWQHLFVRPPLCHDQDCPLHIARAEGNSIPQLLRVLLMSMCDADCSAMEAKLVLNASSGLNNVVGA